MELVGYLIRILCVEYTTIARYATMQLFILLAPNALALVNYKTIGEVIRLSEVKGSPFFLRSKFVTWFFFASDVFSFLLQGSGSGLQATGGKSADTGKSIILAGLFIQLIFLACFGAIVIYISRNDNYVFYVEGQTAHKKHLIACMSVTFIFIYIRSIYRVIEFSTGYDGPVAKAEWAFYVFDTLAIAICFIVYAVYFIGNYLPKCKDSEQASTRSISIDFTEAKKFHSQNV
ncbi:RTA-like protein [Sporodiniella umbellata]|nr:RTA-like protein [Sporodiniella umbellata]